MDGVGVLKSAFRGAHDWYLGTVADVGAEQANSVPPGAAHPIGSLMAHILHCEDFMLNTAVQGKPSIWERDGWAAECGGGLMVDLDPDVARAYKCDAASMGQYAQAVFANTDAFLGGLKDSDLDGEVNLLPLGFPNNMALGDFLSQMLLGNTYAHTGEISSLKGTMGLKGYPF